MRTCSDCGQTKPLEAFTPIKGTPYYNGRCKPCRAARARGEKPAYRMPTVADIRATAGKPDRKPQFPPGIRMCSVCGSTKSVDQFTRIKASPNGFYGACKACRAAKVRARCATG